MSVTTVTLGLLGCGNVGSAFVELLAEQRDEIAAKTGLDLVVKRIAVRSATDSRGISTETSSLTTDAASVVADPEIDVIIELIGGLEQARELVLSALASGKSVVTANKELLANYGAELYGVAATEGVDLLFEAAVAGAIPLMRPIRESLAGEPIELVMGIVNGTTNYILSQMSEVGTAYQAALAEAQNLGYAERDPTADVEGYDAAAKVAIIASAAFGTQVAAGDVYREGISSITSADINFASRLGFTIKLLAIAERVGEQDGMPVIAARVHPAMIPVAHPLAGVRDSFNAVFVVGGAAGELMFFGRGAGGRPTASAVLGDVIDAAANKLGGVCEVPRQLVRSIIQPIDQLESEYYLNLEVVDRPGALADVASIFGSNKVSIRLMEQEGLGEEARLIFITHRARERDVRATLEDLRSLDSVRQVGNLLRVVGEDTPT